MKIAFINNAANYLYFNVNFAKYLETFGHTAVFLNTDRFIGRQLRKHKLRVDTYPKVKEPIEKYGDDSGIIRYLKQLYHLSDTRRLIELKNREYTEAYHYFKSNPFDCVILLNGAFNVETDVCRELNKKTFFFEHAYIPKAIQMDPMGVNSGSSFANLSYDALLNFHYPGAPFSPLQDFDFEEVKYKMLERYILRLTDSNYTTFLKKYIRRKRNLTTAQERFSSFKEERNILKEGEKYIFFPLQVNSDTQIVLNSPYESMYAAIDAVLPELKKTGYKIIIKEHPKEVEPVDYSRYEDNQQVFIVKKVDLEKCIEQAEFVVNINSSVGFQALAKYKKVLVLGESFYKNSPMTVYYPEVKGKDLLKVMAGIVIDQEKIDAYMQHFTEKIFLKGHFYAPDVEFFERIRNRLVEREK